MIIYPQPPATPEFEYFKISLFGYQSNYFTILLIYKTQPWLKSLKNYFKSLCFKNFSQRWTKVVETKLENLVNSKNDLIFQILNSPPYAAISNLSLTKFS